VVIGALGSPLGPNVKRVLVTDLYYVSTPIARYGECNHQFSFKRLQEIYDIATRGDHGMGISFRNPSKMDLATDLYSVSTLVANNDGIGPPDPNDLFRSLNTYMISLELGTPNSVTQIEWTLLSIRNR
jgi:hypothetical protein